MGHTERHGLGDILVSRNLSDREVASFLAHVLGFRPDEVSVIDDTEQVLAQPPTIRVVCPRSVRPGEEYPMLLSPWGATGLARPFRTVVTGLCKAFNCQCLIDDGTSDPYSWLQIDGDGEARSTSYYGP